MNYIVKVKGVLKAAMEHIVSSSISGVRFLGISLDEFLGTATGSSREKEGIQEVVEIVVSIHSTHILTVEAPAPALGCAMGKTPQPHPSNPDGRAQISI